MASYINGNGEYWNRNEGIKEQGNGKISKTGNIAMALPIAIAFTPMERAAPLKPYHQGLRFTECAK